MYNTVTVVYTIYGNTIDRILKIDGVVLLSSVMIKFHEGTIAYYTLHTVSCIHIKLSNQIATFFEVL